MPLHLQLLVKWEVVSPNTCSRYREFYHEIGNIEKFPFTYWLNGRWFLQIVDIHVGNFYRKLTGRWFPQIHVVHCTVGIYIQYIYNKNCGVSFWTCSREISGDRVALLSIVFLVVLMSPVWWGLHDTLLSLDSTYGSSGPPPKIKKKLITNFHQITSIFYIA